MKKFKCEVAIVSEYEIEIDEEKFRETFLADFSEYFVKCEDWADYAIYIAERKAQGDEFIEGCGFPLINGEKPKGNIYEENLERSVNIKIINENNIGIDCTIY